ncbi:MAG TPA: ABC transporter permease [Longimicrobiales bacterium]|nr:ABC transporter permease [Longimicrobiales bacterium]
MRLESFHEGATLAIDQLRANKFRSGLTILGIVVGVATVMAMSAAIQGIRSSIIDEMERVGPKNFIVARYNINSSIVNMGDGPPWRDNPAITVAEARRIAQLPAIRKAMAGLDMSAEFVNGRQRLASVPIAGREEGWTAYTSATIVSGHDMLPTDVSSSAPVVLLTTHLAETLFGQLDPINRTVRINGRPFKVIGVVQMGDNVFSAVQRNLAIMPYSTMMKHLGAWDGMLLVFAVPTATASQDEAIDQVITLLRTTRGLRPADDNNFAVIRQEEFLETFNKVTGIFFIVMLALSSVALMVGGVGVIAIMMIAVTERTREIGIRKAIGATRREILWQFLFEAVTLTCIGTVIGMILGASAAYLVAAFTPIPASVPFTAVLAALAMAAVAGVLFGMWPAWKAARMDPVEALRYE